MARSGVLGGRGGTASSPRRAGDGGVHGGVGGGELELWSGENASPELAKAAAERRRGCPRRFPARIEPRSRLGGAQGQDKEKGRK